MKTYVLYHVYESYSTRQEVRTGVRGSPKVTPYPPEWFQSAREALDEQQRRTAAANSR